VVRSTSIDYGVVAAYFVIVMGLGFWYQKRASRNLEAYFLGGRRMHWLALAMSGSVSTFDITGTMWIVSLLFVLGMRSMWNHWMWGWMMGAFFFAYMGKWVQRSKVMTGAEWMVTRFGEDTGGRVARTAYALMAVLTQAAFIGYAFQGIGKFASTYVDLSANTCAVIVIGVTTLYVVLGGLYSVVVTDVVQTVILTIAAIVISAVAYTVVSPEVVSQTLPGDWASVLPRWHLPEMAANKDYASYEWFGPLVIVWVLKGLFLNAGGPAQMYDFQRFLAAKNPQDAAKLGASWSVFLIVRWAMCMGIVLLALTGGADVADPERVMPVVLQRYLPMGIRGLVIAGLLAAFMSTFSSTVNSGASYIVRDFYPAAETHGDHRNRPRARGVCCVDRPRRRRRPDRLPGRLDPPGLGLADDGARGGCGDPERVEVVLVAGQRLGVCRGHARGNRAGGCATAYADATFAHHLPADLLRVARGYGHRLPADATGG